MFQGVERHIRDNIFRGSQNILELPIPNSQQPYFKLLYAPDLVLTPDVTILEMARRASRFLPQQASILDLGTGSGIFGAAMVLADEHHRISRLVATDIDPNALSTAEYNQKRAKSVSRSDQIFLEYKQSDWLTDVQGRFDLIYFNPPYVTNPNTISNNPALRADYGMNPVHAIYVNGLIQHYDKVFAGISEYVHDGSLLIVRVPAFHSDKVNKIIGSLAAHVHGYQIEETVLKTDSEYIGRYLSVRFH